jgi:hypothetical protein
MVCCSHVVSRWGNGALHQVFLSMIPERVDDSHSADNTYPRPSRRSRRRRHRQRFYRDWIRPYRRQLRTVFLLCVFVIAAYLLWNALAAS